MLRLRAALFIVITLVMTMVAFAAPNFPALTGRLVDGAGVISADSKVILENRLRDYEAQTGHQIAIATVPSLEGYDVRDYGYQLGRAWALGQKGKNDGVLVLVAPAEHKVSIEAGYGLEGVLTDAMSSVIINTSMVPKFKAGDYAGGLYNGVDSIIKVIGGQADQVVQESQSQSAPKLADILPFIVFFIIVLFIISRASRGRRVIIVPGGYYGGGYSSGGGFSSGGFSGGGGGFSGGGGSFGGGGASGGW